MQTIFGLECQLLNQRELEGFIQKKYAIPGPASPQKTSRNRPGLISALRSFSEFTAAPMLASWSDRHGRKWALLLSSVAFVLEAALIAVPWALGGL